MGSTITLNSPHLREPVTVDAEHYMRLLEHHKDLPMTGWMAGVVAMGGHDLVKPGVDAAGFSALDHLNGAELAVLWVALAKDLP